ncbi:SusC/RagA family TonB-linked outer membrane protein [Bergeyella sp. RCAD1439]|uniref:SusC/RagA family TonB-linked outer membrane protein n=1 Tax=Bergeyella anatis TaxID=3113737 RepID=UPI002E195342|nr:SusC/RagA family TonB-linked outer membrane protein [Bergeyella sp. RCAD1439]
MGLKRSVLTAGVLFFMGGQEVLAQKRTVDTTKTKDIEEVVVLGFGQKKAVKELTGSVGRVGAEVADVSMGSIDKAMAGRVAGVQTGMATGQPGGAAYVRIRGMASVNGRNNPIIIVDGVRVAQGDLSTNTTTSNILANLNDSDIESVTMLKDAVSTAVYGADAGAGVMIITTKAGRKGKPKFSFSNESGVSFRAVRGHESLSAAEWKDLIAQGLANRYSVTKEQAYQQALSGARGATLQDIFNSTNSTDWRRETEKNSGAFLQNVNGSVSGGNDRLTYYSSLGYFNQSSIVKSSYFKRVTGTNKVTYKATDKLNLSTDVQFSFGELRALIGGGGYSNPILGQYFLRPTDAVRNADGTYNYGDSGYLSNGLFNVAAVQQLDYSIAKTARVFANFQAEYKILKNLSYKFVFAPEYINLEEDAYNSPLHGDGYSLKGALYSYASRYFNFNIQNILSYNFRLGDRNNFNASLIQEAYKSDYRLVGGVGNAVGTTSLKTLDSFIIPREAVGRKSIASRGGYAATLHYDYDRLVLLDLSGREDRVSNFWPDKKTGYFWSAGLGVDLARLEMLRSSDVVSQLKLSASYGSVGNLPSSDVIPYSLYRYSSNYNNQAGATLRAVDNPDLKWETLKPFNAQFDLGLFNDRLNLTAAYYHKTTSDMIFDIPLSMAQGGYTVIGGTAYARKFVNVGAMVNSGFEFTLGGQIVKGRDFSWRASANISTLDNRITKLYDGKDVVKGDMILREGEAANSFYMRKWAGVDETNGKPLWYVNGKDGETTSDYNKAQLAIQGAPYAKVFGGFDTQLSYKGFSLDAQLSYGFGNKIYDYWGIYLLSDGQYTVNYPGYRAQLDYWTPDNPKALNPAPIYGLGNNNANAISSRLLYKGDYMRLRVLKVSYSFKKELLRNTGLEGAQVYVLGNNIWTYVFDKNLRLDPDLAIQGTSNLNLPPLKTFSLGVNLNF